MRWAQQVARMAQGFNDSQCHLLDVVLENTPEILCDLLTDNYTSWTDFKTDVTKVSASQLLRVKQRLTMDRKLREDVDKLQNQMADDRKTMQSSSQTTQVPYVMQPPYRGYPQTPSRRGGSPADHMRTATQYATIPHHPNSEASKQAYAQQIQEWHTQHGADAIPNSQRPYPLKPGTSPIGSRECFNCGLTTSPPHQAYDCANKPVPMQETKWRETVSRLVSRTLAVPTTPGPTSNVQFITNTAPSQYAIPQNPYPAPAAAYPQYSYFAEPYETYHAAGNEFGLQQDEQSIVDLYAISDNDDAPSNTIESTPFVTQIILYGPGAKTSCFQANIDDGAMINAIDLKTFNKASKHLKKLTRSNRILRMANGTQSLHIVQTNDLEAYADVLSHAGAHVQTKLQRTHHAPPIEYPMTNASLDTPGKDTPVWPVVEEPEEHNLGEIPEFLTPPSTTGIYSRHTNPFRTERVEEILHQIKIGDDLTQDQQAKSARSFQSLQGVQTHISRRHKVQYEEDVKGSQPHVLAQRHMV
ncbi:hypothetical protein DFH29DRAFT_884113 [Suillus ampliporus]|nr:hypothetical protein DFH29DRAFT_884113 [Suillus ampliporus]